MIVLFAIAALTGAHNLTHRQAEQIAYHKCGPEGTVDWDDNRAYPPPHCNRNGWNGKRYVASPAPPRKDIAE